MGITEEQLRDLARFRESDAYAPAEKAVLALADAMSRTPAVVSDDVFAEARRHFDDTQLLELIAAVAWENYRARLNRALDTEPQGYSEGAFCALPEHAQGR